MKTGMKSLIPLAMVLNLMGLSALGAGEAAVPPQSIQVSGPKALLGAAQAETTGKIRLEGEPKNALGNWVDAKDTVSWRVECPEAVRMDAVLTLACAPGSGGSEVEIACGSSTARAKVFETKDRADFVPVPMGPLDLPKGVSQIVLRALSKPEAAQGVMNIRSLSLEKGFADLFDGKSLKGWMGSVEGYAVKDGFIYCIPEKGGNLLTAKEYSDFDLRFEFRLYPGANNGLGIRTPSASVDAAYEGMEIQILDDRHPMYKDIQPWQAHGSIYNVAAAKRDRLRKCGEWNVEQVIADGRHIVVILNGDVIVDANLDDVKDPEVLKRHPGLARKSGYIGFLGHGTQVDIRNIRLKELK